MRYTIDVANKNRGFLNSVLLKSEFRVGTEHCEVCSGLEYVLSKNNY